MRPYIIEHARRFGLGAAARYAVWRVLDRAFGYTPYRCFVRAVAAGASAPQSAEGIACRPLAPGEVESFACADPRLEIGEAFLAKARQRGDICIGAFDGSQLVGYAFSSTLPTEFDGEFCFAVPRSAVYNYKAFVMPSHRGRRVHAQLWEARRQLFCRLGHEHMAAIVVATNYPSLRSLARLGFRNAFGFALIGSRGRRGVVTRRAPAPSERAVFRVPKLHGEFTVYSIAAGAPFSPRGEFILRS